MVRFSAAVSLGNLKNPKAYEVLLEALESKEALLQQAAIAALGEIKATESLDRLLQFVPSEDWWLRQRLAEALGNLPSAKTISALNYLAKDTHPQVAAAAKLSLQRLSAS
ncbi:MAG: HEAT repeat domain-containing protein [Geitlerinemataceae cyanobacterium]